MRFQVGLMAGLPDWHLSDLYSSDQGNGLCFYEKGHSGKMQGRGDQVFKRERRMGERREQGCWGGRERVGCCLGWDFGERDAHRGHLSGCGHVCLESHSWMWGPTHLLGPELEAKLNSVPIQMPGWN